MIEEEINKKSITEIIEDCCREYNERRLEKVIQILEGDLHLSDETT